MPLIAGTAAFRHLDLSAQKRYASSQLAQKGSSAGVATRDLGRMDMFKPDMHQAARVRTSVATITNLIADGEWELVANVAGGEFSPDELESRLAPLDLARIPQQTLEAFEPEFTPLSNEEFTFEVGMHPANRAIPRARLTFLVSPGSIPETVRLSLLSIES